MAHAVLSAGLEGGGSGPGAEQGIESGVELLAVSVTVLEGGQLAGHVGGVEAAEKLTVEGIVGEFVFSTSTSLMVFQSSLCSMNSRAAGGILW